MHSEARQRLQMETDFRLALEREEFVLHYQPIVELRSGQLVGVETLVRWQHPVRGLLSPGAFLAVAEETGLIVELDGWVLRNACKQLSTWRQWYPQLSSLVLNVNVDERQMASMELTSDVAALLDEFQLPAKCLRLEVTEGVFRSGSEHGKEQLAELKALGVGLAVDDFGTGYSSLSNLAKLPVSELKIDRSFMADLEESEAVQAMVTAVIRIGETLKLRVVAEGVETLPQRRFLEALGCDVLQGYLFGQAMSPQLFEEWLDRHSNSLAPAARLRAS
jgi:EAL domain-containing protein (putative c-di-GMP-specific phosphodiesterase class I)